MLLYRTGLGEGGHKTAFLTTLQFVWFNERRGVREGCLRVIFEIATVYASASTFLGSASTFRKSTRKREYFCSVRVLLAERRPPS